jgi:hypothetical protein
MKNRQNAAAFRSAHGPLDLLVRNVVDRKTHSGRLVKCWGLAGDPKTGVRAVDASRKKIIAFGGITAQNKHGAGVI